MSIDKIKKHFDIRMHYTNLAKVDHDFDIYDMIKQFY